MADAYWTWPGIFHGFAGSHTLNMVQTHRAFAWSEAWAEFLAEVSFDSRYGIFFDLDSQESNWGRNAIPSLADHSLVEGEIASAMWDIFDPTGWETAMVQYPEITGTEEWEDSL